MGIIKAHLTTAGKIYSGSFTKLLALGENSQASGIAPLSGSILDECTFGLASDPLINSTVVGSENSDFVVPAGTYLEGPICYFKVKATIGGTFLAYYDTDMPFSNDEG